MERIKISELKRAIETARENCSDPISRDALDRLMRSVLLCPPQYLRITKMYDSVMKIKSQSKPVDANLNVMQNFQEIISEGF